MKLDYEQWEDENYDNLYCEFMESGMQYELDVDRERWFEDKYEEYLNEPQTVHD